MSVEGAPQKKEGDLKSPAGFFRFGTAFGYADAKDARWIKNRYIKATDTLICVDDLHSTYYNNLINPTLSKADYHSFEEMHRKDNAYKWGLFINHNSGQPEVGKGSCIFMHIWQNAHTGTVGCTAMREADLLRVLHWINAAKNPLLVQVPRAVYLQLQANYNLPSLP